MKPQERDKTVPNIELFALSENFYPVNVSNIKDPSIKHVS
jgi:hypothetical protein